MAKKRTRKPAVKKPVRTEVEEQIIREAIKPILKESDTVSFIESVEPIEQPTEQGAAILIDELTKYIKSIVHLSRYRTNNIGKELTRIKRKLRC